MSEKWNGEGSIRRVEKNFGKPQYKLRNEDKSAKDVCVVSFVIRMWGLDTY